MHVYIQCTTECIQKAEMINSCNCTNAKFGHFNFKFKTKRGGGGITTQTASSRTHTRCSTYHLSSKYLTTFSILNASATEAQCSNQIDPRRCCSLVNTDCSPRTKAYGIIHKICTPNTIPNHLDTRPRIQTST